MRRPEHGQILLAKLDRLASLVERSWKVEKVEEYIEEQSKSRLEILQSASGQKCVCGGRWIPCAMELLCF